jgi:pimeloyl-ACP methyl ester carboxylesterase
MRRTDIKFASGDETCEAWLYSPDGPAIPRPCVVIAHGIGAIRQVRLRHYAERFTLAGYAVLTFDYRHWGASSGSPRYLCSIRKQHEDIEAAIDCVKSLQEVDAARVFLFGTSFGGGHVLVVGSRRPDLAGVMSQCTVSDCAAVALKTPLHQIVRWIPAGIVDQFRGWFGMSPKYIKLAGEPGEAALMTKLGAEERYHAMIDEPSPWMNLVAARVTLWLPLYRPIRYASHIESPLLMLVCDRDEICPPTIAAKAADLASRGRAVHFDSSHFDIYFGELFAQATSSMLDFMATSELATNLATSISVGEQGQDANVRVRFSH